ncbi:hypothetical protein, partial [Micromonospora sp. NPDC049204]|uniref:hypothetical protein n=1 Tax=Micromonospora sp. NPDC049204 TaxID=3154351 RepID=UPI0033E0D676
LVCPALVCPALVCPALVCPALVCPALVCPALVCPALVRPALVRGRDPLGFLEVGVSRGVGCRGVQETESITPSLVGPRRRDAVTR